MAEDAGALTFVPDGNVVWARAMALVRSDSVIRSLLPKY